MSAHVHVALILFQCFIFQTFAGGEVKKMFRAMALRPGDGLKLVVSSRASGIPTTRLTVIPAGA